MLKSHILHCNLQSFVLRFSSLLGSYFSTSWSLSYYDLDVIFFSFYRIATSCSYHSFRYTRRKSQMITSWPISKDELYGPPPAYSVNPPPPTSIYTITETRNEYQERPSSHTSIVLSTNFLRYLLGAGLLHILIGITSIVCDILLIGMHESYPFTGIWAGVLCIIFGIYLILFMSYSEKQTYSLHRFKLIHILVCLIIIIALILSSINLASNSCYEIYYEPDQCRYSTQKLKIVLVTFFAFTFLQICITSILTFVHIR